MPAAIASTPRTAHRETAPRPVDDGRARASFFCIPCEKSVTSLRLSSASCMKSATPPSADWWFRVQPVHAAHEAQYSGAVSRPCSAIPPALRRSAASSPALRPEWQPPGSQWSPRSAPATCQHLDRVDLPAPFGPRKPKNCPDHAQSDILHSRERAEARVSPWVWIAAVSMCPSITSFASGNKAWMPWPSSNCEDVREVAVTRTFCKTVADFCRPPE